MFIGCGVSSEFKKGANNASSNILKNSGSNVSSIAYLKSNSLLIT
jgi:hypothetical protein